MVAAVAVPKEGNVGATLAVGAVPNRLGGADAGVPNVRLIMAFISGTTTQNIRKSL